MHERHSLPVILLHWMMAIALVAAWVLGNVVESIPPGPARGPYIGWHALFGLVVVILLLPRMFARLTGPVLADPPGTPGWMHRAAATGHLVLYALMAALPASGLLLALTNRRPINVVGLFEIPPVLASYGIRGTVEAVHGLAANLLLLVVAVHVAATLWHWLVRHDGVAARIFPTFSRQ